MTLHHLVLFELANNVSEAKVQRIIDDGIELLSQIPGVLDVDLGIKARENRDVHLKNYQLGLYVKLQGEAALDVYSPHEYHQEFLARHKSKWTSVQVVDFFGN